MMLAHYWIASKSLQLRFGRRRTVYVEYLAAAGHLPSESKLRQRCKPSRVALCLRLPNQRLITSVQALRSHRVRQLEARLAAGGRWQDRGFVFTSAVGTPTGFTTPRTPPADGNVA
jgi:hypothetical protein